MLPASFTPEPPFPLMSALAFFSCKRIRFGPISSPYDRYHWAAQSFAASQQIKLCFLLPMIVSLRYGSPPLPPPTSISFVNFRKRGENLSLSLQSVAIFLLSQQILSTASPSFLPGYHKSSSSSNSVSWCPGDVAGLDNGRLVSHIHPHNSPPFCSCFPCCMSFAQVCNGPGPFVLPSPL